MWDTASMRIKRSSPGLGMFIGHHLRYAQQHFEAVQFNAGEVTRRARARDCAGAFTALTDTMRELGHGYGNMDIGPDGDTSDVAYHDMEDRYDEAEEAMRVAVGETRKARGEFLKWCSGEQLKAEPEADRPKRRKAPLLEF